MFIDCKTEQEWLANRLHYLTASDAGNYMGVNPYDPNGRLHLWEEKVGLKKRPDISEKPAVKFGKTAEEHIRAIFMLKHPEFELQYDQFGIYVSDDHPFLGATLDGLLLNKGNATHEILEIKTGRVHDKDTFVSWVSGELPINYYCQILHQSVCLPWAVGIWVVGLISVEWDETKSYFFTHHFDVRDEGFLSDRRDLIEKAEEMHTLIEKRKRPGLVFKL